MANIQSVDYEKMPSYAKKMREQGNNLNKEITSAYTNLKNMKKSWYGVRYNTLVKSFNKMIPSLNQMLTLVVTDIPFSLETVANNFSSADKGRKVVTATKSPAKKLTNVSESKDVGLHFVTSEVDAKRESIAKNFNKAKELMNEIERTYKQINWRSESADAFKAKFTKLKAEIVKSFESIENQFRKLMNQALEDMKKTENANTVK